jgi:polyhydroxybutyrate depolymerase
MKHTLLILISFLMMPLQSFAADSNRDAAKIVLPENHDSSRAWPVILLLHGYSNDSESIDKWLKFSKYVTERGFILVVPNGSENYFGTKFWNATEACCNFQRKEVDDVGYLKNLAKSVAAKYNGDLKKIFAVGHSNGGFMAHRLACDEENLFAGIVSVAGLGVTDASRCTNPKPVNVLQIHALDDDTIKYNGDTKGFWGLSGYPGAETTIGRYVIRNGCDRQSITRGLINIIGTIPFDDTVPRAWQCSSGAKVELWAINQFKSMFHQPHSPHVKPEFTTRILDFLLK